MWLHLGLLLFCLSHCFCKSSTDAAEGVSQYLVASGQWVQFGGMCDASGAIPISSDQFIVADDEDNVLRVYSASKGGFPVSEVDLSSSLNLDRIPKKDPTRGFKKPPESDLEAATRLGSLAFWLTSHGRNASGQLKRERFNFFATSIAQSQDMRPMELVGIPYASLLHDLVFDERFKKFDLQSASNKSPKAVGGLNIEGMTERKEGGVFIGFRNPIPNDRALVIILKNPEEVIRGLPSRFGDPLTLDLGGLEIRSMSRWKEHYLIIAGHYSEQGGSTLFRWDGQSEPKRLKGITFGNLNPEGFFTPEELDRFMILSDDGALQIDGVPCKRHKDGRKKTFRGVWIDGIDGPSAH